MKMSTGVTLLSGNQGQLFYLLPSDFLKTVAPFIIGKGNGFKHEKKPFRHWLPVSLTWERLRSRCITTEVHLVVFRGLHVTVAAEKSWCRPWAALARGGAPPLTPGDAGRHPMEPPVTCSTQRSPPAVPENPQQTNGFFDGHEAAQGQNALPGVLVPCQQLSRTDSRTGQQSGLCPQAWMRFSSCRSPPLLLRPLLFHIEE